MTILSGDRGRFAARVTIVIDMCRRLFLFLFLFVLSSTMVFAQKRAFDANALMELKRIERSADFAGRQMGRLHACKRWTWPPTGSRRRSGLVPLAGGAPRQITHDGEDNERARWSPDSKRIAYVSDRGGSSQIWLMDPDGGNAKQVTNLATEADGVTVSPDGKNLLFTSEVYPECGADDACNKKLLDEDKASKVKARIYTELLYRHWTALAVASAQPSAGDSGGWRRGSRSYARLARRAAVFARRPGRLRHFARRRGSLLLDECRPGAGHQHQFRSLRGRDQRAAEPRKITGTPGADSSPQYSPDGKYIAWRAQFRAGLRERPLAPAGARTRHRQGHQPHREPGPLGQQLHLVARIRPACSSPRRIAAGRPSS